MIEKQNLKKISSDIWEIPQNYRGDMKVPAWIIADETLLQEIFRDRTIEQLINITTLPGIQKVALVMPDAHEGYGFPIGGVAATHYPDGVISPGGIGYDINCGARLLKSKYFYQDIKENLEKLSNKLYQAVPSGVGRSGSLRLSVNELDDVLQEGVPYMIKKGFGEEEDIDNIESSGVIVSADPKTVSLHAKNRGQSQLGTMGAGNHFIEVEKVETIFDQEKAQAFGLFPDQVVILIHTGSRGLGHQVATDYIRTMLQALFKYNIHLPDRELACAPLSSPEGQNYFAAMAAAANFAWANRQVITREIRKVWQSFFGRDSRLSILYDVAHNIAKIEEYKIDGVEKKVIIHRKGATRAFPPGHPELPPQYQTTGQPVIVPGSMGTGSYIMVGTDEGMSNTFGSCAHGAGRRMSRKAAKAEIQGHQLLTQLAKEGIIVKTGSIGDLAEEAPLAYKNIDNVVDVIHEVGVAKKVCRLKPLIVIKG